MVLATLVVNYDGNGESTISIEYSANFLDLEFDQRLELLEDASFLLNTEVMDAEISLFDEDEEYEDEDEDEDSEDEESEDEE